MNECVGVHLGDFRLIVFDIDGTLIGRNQTLPAFTKNTLLRLREEGWDFTLATGKTLPATKELADELEIDLPLILCNGALIETRFGEILARTSLLPEVTSEIIRICDHHDQDLVLYIEDSLYVRKLTENMLPIYGEVREGLYEVGNWDALDDRLPLTNKCVVVDTQNKNGLADMEIEFCSIVDGRADVVRSSDELLEVLPKGVDKASGLIKLVELLGFRRQEVIAFGDYDNDASMLAAAGLGVAVRGASKAAIDSADILVDSCEQEGPAKFLAALLERL